MICTIENEVITTAFSITEKIYEEEQIHSKTKTILGWGDIKAKAGIQPISRSCKRTTDVRQKRINQLSWSF